MSTCTNLCACVYPGIVAYIVSFLRHCEVATALFQSQEVYRMQRRVPNAMTCTLGKAIRRSTIRISCCRIRRYVDTLEVRQDLQRIVMSSRIKCVTPPFKIHSSVPRDPEVRTSYAAIFSVTEATNWPRRWRTRQRRASGASEAGGAALACLPANRGRSAVKVRRFFCEYACEHAPISEPLPSRYSKSVAGATPSTGIDSPGYED